MPSEDLNSYMEQMYLCNPLVQPLLQRVVGAASFPGASRGLDAGCGVGLQIPLLAAAVGPQGRITGLDIAPEFLAEAKDNVKYKGLTDRVTFCQSDIYDPPFENEEFDWIWSANCACYAVRQPLQLLQGFRRTLKPGGLLLLLIR